MTRNWPGDAITRVGADYDYSHNQLQLIPLFGIIIITFLIKLIIIINFYRPLAVGVAQTRSAMLVYNMLSKW